MDPGSRGPSIDQYGRCSDPAYFAAGNVLRAVETAGWSYAEGVGVGRNRRPRIWRANCRSAPTNSR